MNLIQIQDKLKSLPNDPRVMQMLTSYANGQNPQVPPYLALGELNRRKGMLEQAQKEQAGQPPGGTIKDQIEQQTGIMAQRQQQMQAAQGQAMNAAQMAPAQGIAQGVAQPQGMASGGLASLRPSRFRSGGVIAFQEAGSVDDAVSDQFPVSPSIPEQEKFQVTDPRAALFRLMKEAEAARAEKPKKDEEYLARRRRLIEENPDEFGALKNPIGKDAMARLDELQNARRAELATQKEELAKSKPGILQLLGQAAMGTRGQYGKSALASILGGYSELSNKAGAEQLQQEQALRMKELDLQQAKAEALSKVEDAKRSYAEGNLGKAETEMKQAAQIASAQKVSLNNLLGREITALGSLAGKESVAQTAADTKLQIAQQAVDAKMKIAEDQVRARLAIGFRPSEKERILGKLNTLRKNNDVEGAEQLLRDVQKMQGGAAGVGQSKSDRLVIEAQIRNANNILKDYNRTPEEKDAAKVELDKLNNQLKELGPKPKETVAAQPITPDEFNKQWGALKPGQKLIGPDGKTYTKGK